MAHTSILQVLSPRLLGITANSKMQQWSWIPERQHAWRRREFGLLGGFLSPLSTISRSLALVGLLHLLALRKQAQTNVSVRYLTACVLRSSARRCTVLRFQYRAWSAMSCFTDLQPGSPLERNGTMEMTLAQ